MPVVFITGSGRRIGKGLAIEFARCGWDVAVHYHQSREGADETVREIIGLGQKAVAVQADVMDYKEFLAAFESAKDSLGAPDVLVNNSGIFPPRTAMADTSDELWETVINTNLRGEFYGAKIFSKYSKKGSRIVNIASLGGLEIWDKRLTYHVSKAGVIQLTKALARELAPDVSVNCVCPGSIFIPEDPSINDTTLINVGRIPMGRYGAVRDVFDAVYFFATASSYITGQVISVDGGYHDAR